MATSTSSSSPKTRRRYSPKALTGSTSTTAPARSGFSVSSGSADIERDGDFDIFVSNGGGSQDPAKDTLLENLSLVVSVPGESGAVPADFTLSQSYPNPFNPATTIEYSVTRPAFVRLAVYDALGRRVKALVHEHHQQGRYRIVWDGTNEIGRTVASGVYFYKLSAEGETMSKRMILQK